MDEFEEDFSPPRKESNGFKSLANNECLPLVESFQLSNQNEESECPLAMANELSELDEQDEEEAGGSESPGKNEYKQEDNDEEIKSISSIEGSLKGMSSNSNYEELAGLSSSTPLIHLYPMKLGNSKFYY